MVDHIYFVDFDETLYFNTEYWCDNENVKVDLNIGFTENYYKTSNLNSSLVKCLEKLNTEDNNIIYLLDTCTNSLASECKAEFIEKELHGLFAKTFFVSSPQDKLAFIEKMRDTVYANREVNIFLVDDNKELCAQCQEKSIYAASAGLFCLTHEG